MDTHTSIFGTSLRQPPSNLFAEQALLGAILANNRALDRCGELLPVHFADPVNARIFMECRRLIDEGRLADAVTLKTVLEGGGTLDEVGGTPYLATLLSAMVGIINAGEYAGSIREAWLRRQLIAIGEDLVNGSFSPPEGEAGIDLANRALQEIDNLSGHASAGRMVSIADAVQGALEAMEVAIQRKGVSGVQTGFRGVDDRLGGMEPGSLTVLAGRPGMGKSALGWQWAIAAARSGVPVLVISLEMSATELGRRALATLAGVPIWAIKKGMATMDQTGDIVGAQRELSRLPIMIEDGAGLTSAQIAAKARTMKRKGLGLVMVDHLHIVRPDDADVRQGATWAVGRISGAMKRLAKDCECPVLLLAQLNRGVEARDDKRPGLSDLRQAGDIEQDADAVAFVYRAEYYARHEPESQEGESPEKYARRLDDWKERKEQLAGKAELIFAKIRDGEAGTVPLNFHGETASFSEDA